MTGEQHERAVEAAASILAERHLFTGAITTTHRQIDAYHASLREQGVVLVEHPKCSECSGTGSVGQRSVPRPKLVRCPRCGGTGLVVLVDLRELVEWLRRPPIHMQPSAVDTAAAAAWHGAAAAIERRFGKDI